MAKYWVIGGTYQDTGFDKPIGEETEVGPFGSFEDAEKQNVLTNTGSSVVNMKPPSLKPRSVAKKNAMVRIKLLKMPKRHGRSWRGNMSITAIAVIALSKTKPDRLLHVFDF